MFIIFRINPLSLVEIIAHVVKQYTNKKEAIAFLEKVEGKVKINDEALALCKVSFSFKVAPSVFGFGGLDGVILV